MAENAALLELAPPAADGAATVYVKGFLGRGEGADQFERWLGCHRALAVTHEWGEGAYGYHWPAGSLLPKPVAAAGAAKGVVDIARVIRNIRNAAALKGIGLMAMEQVVTIAAHFVHQYLSATRSAQERADEAAEQLRALAQEHRRVRVVAHSLGCRHVIEAAAQLAPDERPHEIHLCAPACREEDVAPKLAAVARERTFLYFTEKDRLLDLAFTPVARGRALGFNGPADTYQGLVPVDVSEHFEFWVHGEYKNRLDRLVPEPP